MDFNPNPASFLVSDASLLSFFFKAFAIVLSMIYVLYCVMMVRQTSNMNKTLETSIGPFLTFVAYLQLIIAFALLISAVLFL